MIAYSWPDAADVSAVPPRRARARGVQNLAGIRPFIRSSRAATERLPLDAADQARETNFQ